MQSQRTQRNIAWSVVFVLGFAGASAGQPRPNAEWKAISSRIIKMEVYIPKGRWVRVAVQEGTPARISDSGLNLSVALVPVLADRHVKIHAFRVDTPAPGEERFQWLQDLDTSVGEAAPTKLSSLATDSNSKAGVELLVRVVEIIKAAAPEVSGFPADQSSHNPDPQL